MSTSLLYHTQGIRDFNHQSFNFSQTITWTITRKAEKFQCPVCFCSDVKIAHQGYREIRGMPMGIKNLILRVKMHRIRCSACGVDQMESLHFLPAPKCHYTKSIVKYVIKLRAHMTISAIANLLQLNWNTVKEIEKASLIKKYKYVDLKKVEDIGIDEVYIGKIHGFLTIVRDLFTGRVLFVGDGKSSETLAPFLKKLKRAKTILKNVAIDMGNTYSSWVKENWKECEIIYDHFHVIKSMNDKLNAVRRKTMNELLENEKKLLKESVLLC